MNRLSTGNLIKKQKGALKLNLKGVNQVLLNWNDNMVEVYHDGKRIFVIDMNK